ncbi:MAG TPA: SLC13 family permease [Abditibacteriaceae bacterium]|jgi:di/tricarboxylate transporter
MTWEAWFTLILVAVIFVAMARDIAAPDVLLLGGTIILALVGIITPKEAFVGFANEAMLLVAALFVVVAALRETGAMDAIGNRMLGNAKTAPQAMLRMAAWINTAMVFMTNTAIVAMLLPVITDWCRKNRVSPSKLLIPLSFLTVLRGMTTLLGTSTNLVVNGFLKDSAQKAEAAANASADYLQALRQVGLFEITPLGIACCVVGTIYMVFAAPRLLPDRKGVVETLSESSREYLVDMMITPACRLIGQTVETAGLRALPGLFLIEIARRDKVIAPVNPDELLREGDRLTFTGVVESIRDLERIPGLIAAADESYETDPAARRGRRLCEAVISSRSPLVGQTIRAADFRALYNAAVVAVHRGGERLRGRIGDIRLRAGDTLLLQTGAHFARAHRNDQDFILISAVEESEPVRHDRAPLALALLGLLIVLLVVAEKWINPTVAAFLVAGMMVITRCISTSRARESVDWQTLISIAASFGIGTALSNSGAAEVIAKLVVGATQQWGPIAALAAIYLLTVLFTELITNNAAAALMFPFGLAVAMQMDVSPRPFAIAVMFAASLAFATPIGYQTNLMVYAPGGYKFSDFTRIGLPLNIILWILCTALIPLLWPFALK